MCGCSGGSSGIAYKSSSTSCSGKINKLTDARNKMATLFNITDDPIKKAEYKELKEAIDDIIQQSAITGTCPDSATVNAIVDEVNYEYTVYYNP